MDREKVINELRFQLNSKEVKEHHDPIQLAVRDAEKILALLKEQEAVEPEKEFSGSGVTWWYVCGNCKTAINPNDKFCHECGRPILLEGR